MDPSGEDKYVTFHEQPAEVYKILRHSWVLERRARPYVPVMEGVPLPAPNRNAEENAKYFSVLFRPWTLLGGARRAVPRLSQLGMTPESPAANLDKTSSFLQSWKT